MKQKYYLQEKLNDGFEYLFETFSDRDFCCYACLSLNDITCNLKFMNLTFFRDCLKGNLNICKSFKWLKQNNFQV